MFDLNDLLDSLADRIAAKLAPQNDLESASPWFTVSEAGDYCKLTDDAVRGAEKRGQLRAHRSETGRVRFLRADLDAFLGRAA